MDGNQPIPIDNRAPAVARPESNTPEIVRISLIEPQAVTDLIDELFEAKWTLITIMLLGVGCALAFSSLRPPLYSAHTSIEVQDMNDNFMDLKALDPTDTSNYGSESFLQTQMRIIQSRAVLERTLSKLPESEKRKLVEPPLFWGTRTYNQILKKLSARLDAKPSRQARILDITFLSPDALAGADFVNTLAQELADYDLERRWKTSQRTSEWLDHQLEDFRRKLEVSEKELQDYAKDSSLLITTGNNNVAESKLFQLQQELSEAQANRMAKQADLDRVRKADADSLTEVVEDATLRELRVRLADVGKQLAEAQALYTPKHQTVIKLRAQRDELQRMFDTRRGSLVEQIKNSFASAAERERLLRESYSRQTGAVTDQSAKMVRYNMLKRNVETNRQLYDSLMTRTQEAAVASALRARNILVIDAAYAENKPASPNMPLNAALGGFLGLLTGLLLVVFRQHSSPRFSAPGSLTRILSLRELGAIPLEEHAAQPHLLAAEQNGNATALLPFDKEKMWVPSESYRSIRSSLLYQSGNRYLRCVVFTSATPREGKTTVVSNLAISMAATGRRVLLVDGDLRRPKQHLMFGIEHSPGLSDLLRRERSSQANGDMPPCVVQTPIVNLYLLPSGTAGEDAPELLAGERLPRLLRELEKSFDLVLIDTPPVLACSDARSFARTSDGVVLIVRAEETDRRAAMRARDIILQDGIPIIGTVLTGWHSKRGSYRYYGYPQPLRTT